MNMLTFFASSVFFRHKKDSGRQSICARKELFPEIHILVSNLFRIQAVAEGNEEVWNFLWNELKQTSNANERNNIFRGLACTQEVWILQRYLDLTIDPNSIIRKQDGSLVIGNIAANSVGKYFKYLPYFLLKINDNVQGH